VHANRSQRRHSFCGGRPVTTATAALTPPKHIEVNGAPIRLRRLQQVVWSFLAANAGTLVIVAVYYLLTQVNWRIGGHQLLYLKPKWDGLFSFKGWPQDRHDVRDVYEGALATLFVKSLLANWRKYGGHHVGLVRLITAPLVIIAVAAPIVVAGIFVINHGGPWLWHRIFHHHVIHVSVSLPGWLSGYLSAWNWQPVLIGVIAGLVVHRIYAPVGNTVQLFFIERQVDKTRDTGTDHRPRWPLPPVIRERYAWIMASGQPVHDRGRLSGLLIPVMAFLLFALMVYGAVVRYYIAKIG
jgi:hypothetical protein